MMATTEKRQMRIASVAICFLSLLAVSKSFSYLEMSSTTPPKHTLYDMPVSNNGARCRIILYKKQLPASEVAIVPPSELGGLKSEEYLKINAQGKMPALVGSGVSLAESDTICRYLLHHYSDVGPSFQLDNERSNQIARMHDMYLTTVQGCMYKASPPFGTFATRKDALAEFQRQLQVIEDLVPDQQEGLYLFGAEVSLADATLFPTLVFAEYMLPKFDISPALPPKLQRWFQTLSERDMDFRRVYQEVSGALTKWDQGGRWDSIWLAGLRDNDPPTIFDKIVAGEIPATIVKEDDKIFAFKDINPAAPAHVLVIPKDRSGLSRLDKATNEHIEILGRLLVAAGEISRDESLGFGNGSRIVINNGEDAGQEVPHLHVHVLGGRTLTWPPG